MRQQVTEVRAGSVARSYGPEARVTLPLSLEPPRCFSLRLHFPLCLQNSFLWFPVHTVENGLFLFFNSNSFIFNYFFRIYLLIWLCPVLVAAGSLLSCGRQTLSYGMHVGSSSLTTDRTWAPCIGSMDS